MPIHRLGPTVVNFYLMIITPLMMRIWCNIHFDYGLLLLWGQIDQWDVYVATNV